MTIGPTGFNQNVAYGGGYFNTSEGYYSTSGTGSWTASNFSSIVSGSISYSVICYGNSKFVLVCKDGSGTLWCLTSTNGVTWTDNSTSLRTVTSGNPTDIAWISQWSKFIALFANGDAASSADGITWSWLGIGTGAYMGIVNDGTTVIVGAASPTNRVYRATTYNSWSNLSPSIGYGVWGLAYGNGKFFVFGPMGIWLWSSDSGTTWNAGPTISALSGWNNGFTFNPAHYSGSTLIVLGFNGSTYTVAYCTP